jgi:hypothetical protein
MKTALQQAFARLEELHPSLFDIHTEKGRTFVNEFSKFLEVEREQIIKNSVGLAKLIICNPIEKSGKTFQELMDAYFKQTFKSE